MTGEVSALRLPGSSASLQVTLPQSHAVEERRRVTVLFADLSGSTALGGHLDPEETREILRSYFTALARRIQRFGGTVDKYIGDAVMAVFGAPVAHEDDAERAVAAAMAMRDAITELNADLRDRHHIELALRIGVNTGEVVAGMIAGDVQAAYTVVGDTVNMAQRFESAAPTGEILVGPVTRAATAHAFDYAPTAPLQLKGKSEPVVAYRVVGARAERARPLARHQVASPLVGRDAELARLEGAVARVLDGVGGVVGIIGDAGSGKSRLLAELKRQEAVRRTVWLEGRCFTLGETTRYAPFVEALGRRVELGATDAPGARWATLTAFVRDVLPGEVDETLPFLAVLLGVDLAEPYASEVALMSGEAIGHQVFRTVRRVLTAMARRRPVVLAFEDLHLADASSIALLSHVIAVTGECPLLVVATSRAEPDAPAAALRTEVRAQQGDRYTEVALRPLDAEGSTTLVKNLLAVDELTEQIAARIRTAEGNPLYLEEIIRALIESGAVRREERSGRWRATSQAGAIELPDTVGGLIRARFDRLDERAKEVLRYAAAIGRSFPESVLGVMAGTDDLAAVLATLRDHEMIVQRRPPPDAEHMFKHVLIRETVYETLLRKQRRELHARIAAAIEAEQAGRADAAVGALAYHWARAEVWDKAIPYLERAGDQAGRVAADSEAVERYRDALAAYETTGSARPMQLAPLERKLAEALFRRGEHAQAVALFRACLAHLGTPLPDDGRPMVAPLLRELLAQTWHRTRRAPVPAWRADPVVAEQYEVYQPLSWIDYFGGNSLRQFYGSLVMLNTGERTGHPLHLANGGLAVGLAADVLGFKRLAAGYHRRNIERCAASSDDVGMAYARFGLAYHLQLLGDWDAAQIEWAGAGEIFWRVGDLRRWGVASYQAGLHRWRRGDVPGMLAVGERMVRVADDDADRGLRGWGLHVLGRAQLTLADESAGRTLEEAAAILRAIPDRHILVRAMSDLGQWRLRQGDVAAGVAAIEEAWDVYVRYRLGVLGYTVPASMAQVHLEQAEHAPTPAERDACRRRAAPALKRLGRLARLDAEAQPAHRFLSGLDAWIAGDRRRALQRWRSATDRARELGFQPEIGWTHLGIAERTGAVEDVEVAAQAFARLAAPAELARVDALRDQIEERRLSPPTVEVRTPL